MYPFFTAYVSNDGKVFLLLVMAQKKLYILLVCCLNKTFEGVSNVVYDKGGLILSFSHWLKSPKKKVPNHSPDQYPPKKKDFREI